MKVLHVMKEVGWWWQALRDKSQYERKALTDRDWFDQELEVF